MTTRTRSFLSLIIVVLALPCIAFSQLKTRNVILITTDGGRLQEMFGGIDAAVFRSTNKNFTKTKEYKEFWAETPVERREKLMPFFWKVLMKDHGSIAGNRELGSVVATTNRLWFSYPGYSELLTGEPHDDVIDTNSFGQNRYPSFLNFLRQKLRLGFDQAAAIGSWDAIAKIASNEPKDFLANAGEIGFPVVDKEVPLFNEGRSLTVGPGPGVRHDYFTYRFAIAQLQKFRPRAMFISFGETDEYAHQREYGKYLQSWHNFDTFLKGLWSFLQSDRQYRDKTTIIVTIDHGRGNSAKDWDDHGRDVPEAQYIWMAFVSPDVSLRGEWKNTPELYQNQVAATLSKFMGFAYEEQNPAAGKPIAALFGK